MLLPRQVEFVAIALYIIDIQDQRGCMITFKDWLKKIGKWDEMAGTGPYIGGCEPHADFQVWGACSDQKKPRKKCEKCKKQGAK